MKKFTWRVRLALVTAATAVFAAQSFAAIAEIRITTQNNAAPERTNNSGCNTNTGGGIPGFPGGWPGGGWGGGMGGMLGPYNFPYVKITEIKITENGNTVVSRSSKPDSLRLRGNSTSTPDKKPYRIKFGDKVSLFGDTAAKSWALLANWYDGTFALNSMAFRMGRKVGLEFTPFDKHVNLYINNQYKGIYQLTSQIQSHKGRVDIREKHKGWFVEFDYHEPASDECKSWFKSTQYDIPTFVKAPELDDTIPNRDSSYLRFVKNDINNLVNKMSEGGFPNNGYRDLIDLDSYAKYMLIQMVLDNFDFNNKAQAGLLGSNYAYRIDSSKTSKIKAGPLWDFDLAAGVANDMTFRHYKNYTDNREPTNAFYKRLWDASDGVLKAKYKKLWDKHKQDFSAMASNGGFIDSLKNLLGSSATGQKWNGGDLNTQTFNKECDDLKTWLNNRVNWVDQQLKNFDTSKDIVEKPLGVSNAPRFGKVGNGLSVVKNGLRINAAAPASLKVFTLNGGMVSKQALTAGNHTVSLSNLPRGMYLARVNVDGVKQTVRVAVK
jgi:hypothetical protein